MNQPIKQNRRLPILAVLLLAMSLILLLSNVIRYDEADSEARQLALAVIAQLEETNDALLALGKQIQSSSETNRAVPLSASSGDSGREEVGQASAEINATRTEENAGSPYSLNLESRLASMDEDYRATYLLVVSRFGYVFEELEIDPQVAGNLIDAITESLFELENMRLAYQAGEISREDYIALSSDLVPGRIIRSELSPEKFQEYSELRLNEEMEASARAIYGEMYEFTPGLDIPSRDRIAMAYTAMTWQIPQPQNTQGGLESIMRYRSQYIQEVVVPEIREMANTVLSDDQFQQVINYLDHKTIELEGMSQAVGGN